MEFRRGMALLEELMANKQLKWNEEQARLGTARAWTWPCQENPAKKQDFCNTSLSFSERAWDLTMTLSIDDMAGLLDNDADGISQWNIPKYEWWNEALHGLAGSPGIDWDNPGYATGFPQVTVSAASFNRTLWHMIGDWISTDGRAFFNNGNAGLDFWSPNINIFRDPRWGRGQETPGEDPFINGEYATFWVSGFQGNDETYLKASACCKHFAGYSMEDSDGYTRHDFNAIINDYDLNDTYFPAFKACVQRGKVSGIMCAYNSVNGIPSCANDYLLTETLRNDWGFDGYITSDCGAVRDVYDEHHYTNDWDTTVNVTLSAGMDLDCGKYVKEYTKDAINNGVLSVDTVRRAVYDLFLVQMRLGLFDDPESVPWYQLSGVNVATLDSLTLSREASQQGVVLMKNDGYLPLNYEDQIKNNRIAVIGPGLGGPRIQTGSYQGYVPFLVSLKDAIDFQDFAHEQNLFFSQGYSMDNEDSSDVNTGFDEAVSMISNKDMIILGVGLEQILEREGTDRTTLMLPDIEIQLAEAVIATAFDKGIPVIMIVQSGGCVDLSAYINDPRISAIIWAGYGGMYGGYAVLDVMLGRVNPVGRLTQTWYLNQFINEVEMIDMRMTPNGSYPGRGYRYYNGESVMLPFGYGMSFVSFSCAGFSFNANSGYVEFSIKNLGSLDYLTNSYNSSYASAAVLVFWVPMQPSILQRRLVAFEQVSALKVGSSQIVNTPVYSEFLLHKEYLNSGDFELGGACENSSG